ncbi:MAG: RSP_2648 family PIN domain-containing protein [Sulfitobacter sp.]
MRVLLDACVLFPTVMREMLLGVAAAGAFEPRWSARILEEWALAARKIGPTGEVQARGEIAMISAKFPESCVKPAPGLESRLWLPDDNDIHVLASAIASHSDVIVTANAKDFPSGVLAEECVSRADPDGFLLGHYKVQPDLVAHVGAKVLAEAQRLSGEDWQMRALMKKARLPRLGKALTA